jgi:hypothetical protein
MQNKPNFRKAKMNANSILTKHYEKRTLGERGKTKPKQTQTKPISTPKTSLHPQNKLNQTQFQTGTDGQPNVTELH